MYDRFLSMVGRGYVTLIGEDTGWNAVPRFTYRWAQPDGTTFDLGSSTTADTALAATHLGDDDVPVLLEDTAENPPLKVRVVGANGCHQDLGFTAVASRLTASIAPVPVSMCTGYPLGFLGRGEYAAQVVCGAPENGVPNKRRLITTAGRMLGLAGLDRPSWDAITVLTRSHVLVVPGSATPFATSLRAYDTRTLQPLWSHQYVVGSEPFSLGDIVASPSGARLMISMNNRALVLDPRTGYPLAQLRASRTVKQIAFEDDTHLLLVDDGQIVPYRATSTRAAWIVRCRIAGSCELATPVPPRRPTVFIELAR